MSCRAVRMCAVDAKRLRLFDTGLPPALQAIVDLGFQIRSEIDSVIYGQALSLTLADSCGVGECVFHTMPEMTGNFDDISARPGHARNLVSPYFAANCGDCVA